MQESDVDQSFNKCRSLLTLFIDVGVIHLHYLGLILFPLGSISCRCGIMVLHCVGLILSALLLQISAPLKMYE